MIGMDNRTIKGFSILAKGDMPILVDEETFLVPSQSSKRKYKVNRKQEWTCTCPDFKYRKKECKHIKAVKFFLKFRNKSELEDFNLDFEISETRCIYCNSVNVIKKGIRKTKYGKRQKYLCKDCKRWFILDPVKKHKANGQVITLVMDLYFKGLSLRDIQDTVYQFFRIKVHHETIRRWIMKFTKAMNEYVNKIKVEPKEEWQCDEQMVKSKGKWLWCWNLIDAETRFLLANQVTEGRNINDTRKVFNKAKKVSRYIPEFIVTDGLWSYEKAIKKEFKFGTHHMVDYTHHIRIPSIRDDINNNVVERYHGTFREFDKIRRGFKGREKEMIEAFRLWYNFIRKHESLDGKTPAEAVGIELDLSNNRWLSLLRKSLDKNL